MRKIVYLLGTDGSGKTTLSSNLLNYFHSQKIKATYFYGRHFPFLLQPFKIAGKITALKNTNEFKRYDEYKDKKNTFFAKHKMVGLVYGTIWAVDYLIVTLVRFLPKLFNNKIVIIDRFFLDTTVNISETLNLCDSQMFKLAKLFEKLLPTSTLNIFIKVSPEVAFCRKSDIQSIRYLVERNKRYSILSNKYDFCVINGEEAEEKVLLKAAELIKSATNS